MPLINFLSTPIPFGPCVVGLGTFDGLHLGHQALIKALNRRSQELSLPSVIFTFDHSPRRILDPKNYLGEITTPEEKFSLLMASGVDWVVFRPFDVQFADTSPMEFLKTIVVEKIKSKSVFVGFNFGFGFNRLGNARFLAEELSKMGIEAHVLPPITLENQTVSSSNIRKYISEGNFEMANRLLGKEASFSGVVVHGDHRGRQMGFPTANLSLEGSLKVLPPHGVHLGIVDTSSGIYSAIINIGIRPTFGKTRPLLEAHLLDFQGDIYHRTIRVRFLKKIREEIRFPSVESLVDQIKKDIKQARELLNFENAGK